MYPAGQMSGSYHHHHPCVSCGGGYTIPCCGHGYDNYNPYFPPYPQVYPFHQPYQVSPPVMPPQHHFGHHSPMPGAPVNSHPTPDACLMNQYPVWKPHMLVPPSSCCCACPNHYSYYGNSMNGSASDNIKVGNESEPEDVKRVESSRPIMWNNGSNTSQPQVVWVPPQYVNELQQRDEYNGPKDRNSVGQGIPFDLDKLASLYNKDSNKPVTVSTNKDPFPIILMPKSPHDSKANSTKDRISEIEEKPLSINNSEPLKLLGNDVKKTVPFEPVKTTPELPNESIRSGIQTRNGKVRVKDIPVKQVGESSETKPPADAVLRNCSRSVSPTKTSKLPPVCLRVDPLPRKKNGNVTAKPPSYPSHQKNLQQPVQKVGESEVKTQLHIADKANNVKAAEASSEERTKDNSVLSREENANVKDVREIANGVELTESVKQSVLPETTIVSEKGTAHDLKGRQSMSKETAAVLIQCAYRGYLERKWQSLKKLRQIAKIRDQISSIKDRVQKLEIDAEKEEFDQHRLVIGETIMSHLLTLDTIQGLHPNIRDIRKSVARELISLQERLDLLHAQRSRESAQEMDHGKRESVNNINAKEDAMDTVNANTLQENKLEEDGFVDVYDGKSKEDKSEEIVDSACIKLHQKVSQDEVVHLEPTLVKTETPTGGQGKSLPIVNAGDEVEFEAKDAEGEVKSSGKVITSSDEENTEGKSLEGGTNCSISDAVSEYEPTRPSADTQTFKTNQIMLEREVASPSSNSITTENGAILSGELSTNGVVVKSHEEFAIEECGEALEHGCYHVEELPELSTNGEVIKSNEESAVEECGEALEDVCRHVEEQPNEQDLGSQAEMLWELETKATNTSALEEISPTMEDVNHDAQSYISSDYKPENTAELEVCKENLTNGTIGQCTGDDTSIREFEWNVNPDTSNLPNSKAASGVAEFDKQSNGTESEDSVVTDISSDAATLKGTETKFVPCHATDENPKALTEDVNSLPENDCVFDDEQVTPRLSNMSWASTEADSVVLAEENDKLKETVRKLLESEKDQLAVISTLNERLSNLEKKLKKKRRNKKLKLHSGAMIKSAHENNDERNQNMSICSM